MSLQDDIYLVADELRGIANDGTRYAGNDYDRQRYGRALSLSARLAAAKEQWPADDVMEEYKQSLAHVTSFVAAEAVVLRDDRILLIKREDNGRWAMPGGWTEVGETWAQSVERELREETGLVGTARRLLGVFDSRLWGSRSKYHFYAGVWLVDVSDDRAPIAGPETTDVGFFAEHDLPAALSPGHVRRVPMAFKLARGDLPAPYFDPTT